MSRCKVGQFSKVPNEKCLNLVFLTNQTMFNAYESSLKMNTKDGHVFCEKDKKNEHQVSPKETEAITVLAYINAKWKLSGTYSYF
jgi:hypothetical protein